MAAEPDDNGENDHRRPDQKDHFENPHVGTSEKIHMKRVHFSKEVLQQSNFSCLMPDTEAQMP